MNQFFNCLLTKRCREYMNIRIARPKNRPMYLRRLIILKSHNNLKCWRDDGANVGRGFSPFENKLRGWKGGGRDAAQSVGKGESGSIWSNSVSFVIWQLPRYSLFSQFALRIETLFPRSLCSSFTCLLHFSYFLLLPCSPFGTWSTSFFKVTDSRNRERIFPNEPVRRLRRDNILLNVKIIARVIK